MCLLLGTEKISVGCRNCVNDDQLTVGSVIARKIFIVRPDSVYCMLIEIGGLNT